MPIPMVVLTVVDGPVAPDPGKGGTPDGGLSDPGPGGELDRLRVFRDEVSAALGRLDK